MLHERGEWRFSDEEWDAVKAKMEQVENERDAARNQRDDFRDRLAEVERERDEAIKRANTLDAIVIKLQASACPGTEEHDAYQHMATRALRAEAEVERLKRELAAMAESRTMWGRKSDQFEVEVERLKAEMKYPAIDPLDARVIVPEQLVNLRAQVSKLGSDAARYREALEQIVQISGVRSQLACRDILDIAEQALHPAGREQNNDGAKASDPRSVAGSDSVSLRGGGCQDSALVEPTPGAGAIPAAPPGETNHE